MTPPSARSLAWDALQAIDRGASLDASLDHALGQIGDPRERALLAELVRGVIRWRGRYDHLIDQFAKQPERILPEVRSVLRLGLHQLIACDQIPDYAAVDQSVRLIRSRKRSGQAGFVNGVLQSVRRKAGESSAERRIGLTRLFPDASRDPVTHLVAWTSHPRWLVERWIRNHGAEEATRICHLNNDPPALWLHVLAPADRGQACDELITAGFACEAGSSPRSLRLLDRFPRQQLADLLSTRRHLIVQDLAVQEATTFLGTDMEGPILDLCAAPGGKTLHLRAERPAEELFVAIDRGARRLEPLLQNLERVEPNPVFVLSADGTSAPFADGSFGTVLLDGPCSGTGVLRHHPEGRWMLNEATLHRNADTLLALAREAVRLLRSGGRLLYATCSLEPEENQDVLERLMVDCPELTMDPSRESGTSERRWLPERGGGDGFFAARLRKEG